MLQCMHVICDIFGGGVEYVDFGLEYLCVHFSKYVVQNNPELQSF